MDLAIENIIDAIGSTPLLQLKKAVPAGSARVYAKIERFNPNGSIKDRLVTHLLHEAESASRIKPGDTLITASTGNSGIALAAFGNRKGYKTIVVMPKNYSLERQRILETYKAKLVITPSEEGMPGALKKAKELKETEKAFFVDSIAEMSTAYASMTEEIASEFLDTLDTIDAVVVAFGTGTTLAAMAKKFKKSGTTIVAVEPMPSAKQIQGTGLGLDSVEKERHWADEVIQVSDIEAYEAAQEVARQEGLLIGMSSGAAFAASRKVAQRLGAGKNVVTVFADGGERYFSLQKFFNKSESL